MTTSSSQLTARILTEGEFPDWREFVDSAPAGSIYSYPEYLDALCGVAGGSFRVLAAFRGEEIQGGIALYEREGSGGKVLSGRLLLYYNGIVLKEFVGNYPSKNSSRENAILEALERGLSGMGYAHTQIRSRHPISDVRVFLREGWTARPTYSFLIPLHDLDQAFQRIEQNQRRLIRRCQDEGATVSADDDFDAFYRLHLGTHDRKGAPVYLKEESFRRYFRDLYSQNLCRLYHVRLKDGRPVASQFVLLGGHPVTHTVTAGADPDFLKLGTTPFLRWKSCEHLGGEGYKGNDLTEAALGEVARFKSALGGTLTTNLVLFRPDSLRYRMIQASSKAYRRGRGFLGRIYGSARAVLTS